MNFTKSTKLDHVLYAVLAPSIEEIRGWTDIAAICSSKDTPADQIHFVALKTDGTLIATGSNEFGQCDVDSNS